MNELVAYETYEQFKGALDKEILSAAESFVKIGYLLKKARDTDILRNSGYANLYEFAKAEYGIDKGTVSRYIAINDRFSIGGNAPELQDKYSGRGVAKLQEMLTLSDEVIDAIPEETTKAEIQEIKRDIKAEGEKTDIEVLLENRDLKSEERDLNTLAKQSLYYHLKNDKETFKRIHEVFQNEGSGNMQEQIMKALAPSGVATPRTRIPKVGTILMSIQGIDHEMSFVNVRTNEKEQRAWLYIQDVMVSWFGSEESRSQSVEERYKAFYGEEFEEVAPVQPENEQPKAEDVQESKENVNKVEKAWGVGAWREEEKQEKETKKEEPENKEVKTDSIQGNQELSPLSEEKKEAPETAKIRESEVEIVTGEVETTETEGKKEEPETPQSRINHSADSISEGWKIELPIEPGEYLYKVTLKPQNGVIMEGLKVYMYEIKESKITMRYFDDNDSKEISASSAQGLLKIMDDYDIFKTQEEAQKRLEELNGQEEEQK